jgi:DNA-binding transcriptional regulator YhcF (GntR family)
MNQLAAEINDNRLNVSNALNDMEAEGLINLHRGSIHIPSFERLLKE